MNQTITYEICGLSINNTVIDLGSDMMIHELEYDTSQSNIQSLFDVDEEVITFDDVMREYNEIISNPVAERFNFRIKHTKEMCALVQELRNKHNNDIYVTVKGCGYMKIKNASLYKIKDMDFGTDYREVVFQGESK